jgi:hypothetical protein
VAHYLRLTPKWVDGTAVGGCSFMIHVRHAAAAIASGLCKTVLITHGENGRSAVGRTRNVVAPTSLAGQFEQPYGPMGPPTLFTIPVLRYMKDLWPDARAIGDGLGRAARMGSQEPARHLQSADHGRGCTELADDRLPVPAIAVLHGDRWRRCVDPGFGQAPAISASPSTCSAPGRVSSCRWLGRRRIFTSSLAFRASPAPLPLPRPGSRTNDVDPSDGIRLRPQCGALSRSIFKTADYQSCSLKNASLG